VKITGANSLHLDPISDSSTSEDSSPEADMLVMAEFMTAIDDHDSLGHNGEMDELLYDALTSLVSD